MKNIDIRAEDKECLDNLGSIILCGIAIVVTAFLLFRSEKKQAAVGRRLVPLWFV